MRSRNLQCVNSLLKPQENDMAATTATLPPTKDLDEASEALKLRKRMLKQLNAMSVETRKWIVEGLAADIEKANA